MIIKKAYFILFLFSAMTFSQVNVVDSVKTIKKQSNISFLDSIKSTFKHDKMATKVDSLWMKELNSTDLYDNLTTAIESINLDKNVDFELPTDLLKQRLAAMDAKSPFRIEYNVGLENIIKSFLKTRKKAFEKLMGISEFYFPMFEEALAKQNVPLEIKYLAVVESALNPRATSRVGAAGQWQFMYNTGKQYKLQIDSYIDERRDPAKSSEAAASYLNKMYKIFGDWDLVLASYNSGPGNVSKAIRRSGGLQNYWNIRKNLPRETQGYLPAFLATMYIYEYHKEHGIVPNRAIIKSFQTDTIMVKKQMSFKQISNLLDISTAQLQLLNPSYKVNVIPKYTNKSHALRLPNDKIAVFTSNEDKIYAYLDHHESKKERIFQKPIYTRVQDSAYLSSRAIALSNRRTRDSIKKTTRLELKLANKIKDSAYFTTKRIVYKNIDKTNYYKVKKGDNITEIAQKYNVSIADIKKWNHLKNSNVPLGENLKIVTIDKQRIVTEDKRKIKQDKNIESVATAAEKKDFENENDSKSDFYIVKEGDNLKTIAKKFKIKIADLKQWNNIKTMKVNLDEKLKIKKNVEDEEKSETENNKNATEYIVENGDNLFYIAKKFGVSTEDIQKWNDLKEDQVDVGNKILIFKRDKKIKKAFPIAEKPKKQTKNAQYLVQKGDSLFTIAKKAGVTVSDLKSWNNIKTDDIRPGMKLKISG